MAFSVTLQPGEKAGPIYRQTEWVLAKTALLVSAAAYLPVFLLLRADMLAGKGPWLAAWLVLLVVYGAYRYLLWLLNCCLVTDRRLLSVSYPSLFKKTVTECPLDRIQSVGFSTSGLWSSLLNFGNVEIRVAGIPQPLLLKNYRRPEQLKDFLWELHQASPGKVGAKKEQA